MKVIKRQRIVEKNLHLSTVRHCIALSRGRIAPDLNKLATALSTKSCKPPCFILNRRPWELMLQNARLLNKPIFQPINYSELKDERK